MDSFTSRYLDLFLSHSNPLGSLLTSLIFSRLDFTQTDKNILESAVDGAVPLYILRASSDIDYLILFNILREYGFPEPQNALPGESILLRPVNKIRDLTAKFIMGLGENHQSRLLANSLIKGDPALLALFTTGTIWDPSERPQATRALFNIVTKIRETPNCPKIMVIPVIPIWDKSGIRKSLGEKNIFGNFFGTPENPGRARMIYQVFSSMFKPAVKIGNPIDLKAFIAENDSLSNRECSNLIRGKLSDIIEEEWKTTLGPKLHNIKVTKRALARSPRVVQSFYDAVDEGMSPKSAFKEIRDAINEIPSSPTSASLAIFKQTLNLLWYKIFKGFELDDEGFQKMRDASRKGPLLLQPCHRSHIDYLILSWLMEKYHLPIPHIAAGKNLSFFPMGIIFRRAGAFFIRRTFRGNKLYKSVLLEYLARLFNQGINIEFFPEGTRSRTGKAVYPKKGLLSMVAQLASRNEIPSPQIVPISIGYEKVIEESSYQSELKGKAKKSENFFQIIKSAKVILNKYGKVNVRVCQPFDMVTFLDGTTPNDELFNEKVDLLALTIIKEIINNTLITSSMLTAAALLSSGKNIQDKGAVFSRFQLFRKISLEVGGAISISLMDEKNLLKKFNRSLRGFSKFVTHQGHKVEIKPEGRTQLAYYRNGMVQVIAPLAISALSSFFRSGEYIMYRYLWKTLAREFPQLGIIDEEKEFENSKKILSPLSRSEIDYIGLLLFDIIEGQFVAAKAIVNIVRPDKALKKKQLISAIQSYVEKLQENNSVIRPESGNKSVYIELVELFVSREIIHHDENFNLVFTEKAISEIKLEQDALKGIISRLHETLL
jgi:1-acyl-sn-glycerol-3-phosphate acyltransferase